MPYHSARRKPVLKTDLSDNLYDLLIMKPLI